MSCLVAVVVVVMLRTGLKENQSMSWTRFIALNVGKGRARWPKRATPGRKRERERKRDCTVIEVQSVSILGIWVHFVSLI